MPQPAVQASSSWVSLKYGLHKLRQKSAPEVKSDENVPPRLKPDPIYLAYAGVKTPASLRREFFRGLFSP